MSRKSCIPGYDEALERERRIREEAFVPCLPKICGIEVNQITPFLLAILNRINSPFVCGGNPGIGAATQFLWVLSPAYSKDADARHTFEQEVTMRMIECGGDVALLYDEILEFVDDTFLDAPNSGGTESVPYVCSVAYLIYKMKCEPHRMTREQAGSTPIREIYQYIKCAQYERGDVLYNKSDALMGDFIKEVRAGKYAVDLMGRVTSKN